MKASRTVTVQVIRQNQRIDYLDATRAGALVLGVVFHACLSFSPTFLGWAVQDISTSSLVLPFFAVSHSFRMETFFLLAGFFGCVTFHRQGAGEFIRGRLLRIVVPLVVGWFILRPLLVSGWIMGAASLRGDYAFWPAITMGFATLRTLPTGIFTGTHLWFLYYLAVITALMLVLRGSLIAVGLCRDPMLARPDRIVATLTTSPIGLAVFVVPTAVALWFMRNWGMDTPDQSLGLNYPVLAVYGGFFLLGWMMGRRPERIAVFSRLSLGRALLATIGLVAMLLLSRWQTDPGHPHYAAAYLGFVTSYALTMWLLVSLTIGVFRKLCDRPRPWIRYLADSSYWMYLIHLPIVVWLQVAWAEVALPWALKLTFIVIVTVGVALLSYDVFVRSTWIGWLLNGRRKTRVVLPFLGRLLGVTGKDRALPVPTTAP